MIGSDRSALLMLLYGIHLFPLLTAQCVYPGFNLSQLEGSNIQCPFEDNATNILQFTPCESNLQCSIWDMDRYMVLHNSLGGSCHAGVALFDDAITPRQTTIDCQNAYVFDYANGESSFGCYNPRTLDLTFICDVNADPYGITLCGEKETEICAYYLTIYTQLACSDYTTTTTTIPEAGCVWNVGQNTLNLTSIQGFTLNAISADDPQQIYSLSPCSNNINCNGDFCMAAISTISSCIQTIGRWDGGLTEPEHSNNFGGQWEFVYTNGDGCKNGPESVVSVFWNCNPFAGTGIITAAKQTGTCIFEIHLDSNLACS